MKIVNTKFQGLKIIKGINHHDKRGYFRETFKNIFFKKKKFIFWCMSRSKKNVLRGLHLQSKFGQDKFISVVKGKIFDVVVDLRKNSKTFGNYITCELSKENFKHIYIPSGFAHGFCTLEDNTEVCYKTSNFYSASNEGTIAWNDKKILVNWQIPHEQLIISEKDKKGININDFESPF